MTAQSYREKTFVVENSDARLRRADADIVSLAEPRFVKAARRQS